MKLSNRIAIITGAGRGIGRAIALTFAREGASLVLAARSAGELEHAASLVEEAGGQVCCVPTDVSLRDQVETLIERALARFGRMDILVNNAGIQGPIGSTHEVDVQAWVGTVAVNLFGTFFCTKAALPSMIEQGRGKIINLSGGGATSPRPYFSAYGASKAAVVRFTETVAKEMGAYNIQINAIAPGAVNTGMLDEILSAGQKAGEKELSEAQERARFGGTPPERAAALAVFLASDAADTITGRLISAVWDPWERWQKEGTPNFSDGTYTLRRVDGCSVVIKE